MIDGLLQIVKEIAKLIGLDMVRVEQALKSEPYGIVGGMYNILAYRKMLQSNQTSSNGKEESSIPRRRPTTVHSTMSHSTAKHDILRPITSGANERPTEGWTADVQGTPSRLRVVGSKGVNRTYNLRSAAHKAETNETPSRKIKSEPFNPRQISTGPTHTAERAMKRRR